MIIYTVCISGYVIMYNCGRVKTSTVRNRCVKEQYRKRCCFAASNARFYTWPFLPETCIHADEKNIFCVVAMLEEGNRPQNLHFPLGKQAFSINQSCGCGYVNNHRFLMDFATIFQNPGKHKHFEPCCKIQRKRYYSRGTSRSNPSSKV